MRSNKAKIIITHDIINLFNVIVYYLLLVVPKCELSMLKIPFS